MTRSIHVLLICIVPLSIAIQRCNAMSGDGTNDAFPPHQSPHQAKIQLDRWIPNGTSLTEAIGVLERRGFSCQPAKPAAVEIHAAVICQFKPTPQPVPEQRLAAPGTPVTWFITLNSNDGTKLSEAQVARLPKDIGE